MQSKQTPFLHFDSPEPHVHRRASLLKRYPEIHELYGTDPLAAWIIAGVVLLQITLAWAFQHFQPAVWIWLPFAWMVGGMLNHWLSMGIHEASHDLIFKSTWANRWIAMVANIPILIPAAMTFRRYHLDHHVYLGVEGIDNDLPSRWEARFMKGSRLFKAFWMFNYLAMGVGARGFLRRLHAWEVVNVAFLLVTNSLLYFLVGKWGLAYLLISTFLGHGPHPVAAHWIHEHYLFSESQETYSYYGPLNKVTFNVGYHVEHHDFMWIPWTRLPKLKALAPEYYNPLLSSHSWTCVWCRFIWDRTLGHHSRKTRSKASIDQGLLALRKRI